MHIELRKLKIVAALSEETTCYSAEIWVDGRRASSRPTMVTARPTCSIR